MIPPNRLILLDTNILLYVLRGSPLGQYVDRTYSMSSQSERFLVSVISAGEILALAKKNNWGTSRIESLKGLLRNLTIVDINSFGLWEKYAEIDEYQERNGCKSGQNDTWIAATASVVNAVLLTTDKDFRPLSPRFIELEWVDPTSFSP